MMREIKKGDTFIDENGAMVEVLCVANCKFEGEVFFGKNKQSGFIRTWLAEEVMEVFEGENNEK